MGCRQSQPVVVTTDQNSQRRKRHVDKRKKLQEQLRPTEQMQQDELERQFLKEMEMWPQRTPWYRGGHNTQGINITIADPPALRMQNFTVVLRNQNTYSIAVGFGKTTEFDPVSKRLSIACSTLSQHHAMLRFKKQGGKSTIFLEDTDSLNGTFVLGRPHASSSRRPLLEREVRDTKQTLDGVSYIRLGTACVLAVEPTTIFWDDGSTLDVDPDPPASTDLVASMLRKDWYFPKRMKNKQSLFKACEDGECDRVTSIITAGQDVNLNDVDNPRLETPLHIAARCGHDSVINALIAARANLEARDKANGTPLHTAVEFDKIETVQLLIQSGARLNVKNEAGATPLMLAATRSDKALLQCFIDAGADVLCTDKQGESALDLAVKNDCTENAAVLETVIAQQTLPLPVPAGTDEATPVDMSPGELQLLSNELDRLRKENERLREERMCFICSEQYKDAALVPCGHSFCTGCARTLLNMRSCPVCRTKTTGITRIFN